MEHKTSKQDKNYRMGDLVTCTLRDPETGLYDTEIFCYYWFGTKGGRHVVVIEDDKIPPFPQMFDDCDVKPRATCNPELCSMIMPDWALS